MHSVFAYSCINFAEMKLGMIVDTSYTSSLSFDLLICPLNFEFSMKFSFHRHFMEFYGLCLQVHCIETIFGMMFTVISYRSI
jgi:hypothetical protein